MAIARALVTEPALALADDIRVKAAVDDIQGCLDRPDDPHPALRASLSRRDVGRGMGLRRSIGKTW